jgi:hypothetical protein
MDTTKNICHNWSPGVKGSCAFGQSCKFLHAGGGRSFDPPQPFGTSSAGPANPFASTPFNSNPFASPNPTNNNPFGTPAFSSNQPWPAPTTTSNGFNGAAFPVNNGFAGHGMAFPATNPWNQSSNPGQGFGTSFNPAQNLSAPTNAWGQSSLSSAIPVTSNTGIANPVQAPATSAWSTPFPASSGPIASSSSADPNAPAFQIPNMSNAAAPPQNFAAQNGDLPNVVIFLFIPLSTIKSRVFHLLLIISFDPGFQALVNQSAAGAVDFVVAISQDIPIG